MEPKRKKVAFVTGATRRIGAAIATRLAREGHDLVLHCSARSVEATRDLAKALASHGCQNIILPADLADAAAVNGLMPQAIAAFGCVDLLINNASLFEPDEASAFTLAGFERHMATNLRAPCVLAQALAGQSALASGGVINIIDQRVWRLNPHFFTYTLSKSALWTATQTMAQAFAPRIRVNAIGPGPTLANSRQTADDFAREAHAVPLQRPIGLDEIADAVTYLAGANGVTGQMIAVDAGQHLAWETPDVV